MREIIFRGKRLGNGEWVEGSLHIEYGETRQDGTKTIDYRILGMRGECYYVDPETVGQFIGMTDKNGKKIFEGDIIRTITNGFDRDMFVTEIKFGARRGVQGFYLANGRMMFYWGQTDLTKMDDSTVIGNIHDNPELLEASHE